MKEISLSLENHSSKLVDVTRKINAHNRQAFIDALNQKDAVMFLSATQMKFIRGQGK